jgi:hypothetical protein
VGDALRNWLRVASAQHRATPKALLENGQQPEGNPTPANFEDPVRRSPE